MLVKVWNDNIHDYNEKFRGKQINIPAQKYIEMDYGDAMTFLRAMPSNIQVDSNGRILPISFKQLRIEKGPGFTPPKIENRPYLCMRCKKDLVTQMAYEAHVIEMHAEEFADEDTADRILKKRGRPPKKEVNDDSGNNRDGGKTKI